MKKLLFILTFALLASGCKKENCTVQTYNDKSPHISVKKTSDGLSIYNKGTFDVTIWVVELYGSNIPYSIVRDDKQGRGLIKVIKGLKSENIKVISNTQNFKSYKITYQRDACESFANQSEFYDVLVGDF